ncbi:MAG: hypothetical protein HY754_16205 [Nitrospirae bacterium]|nr:hypothetical protein [Nitrospirota bacterium]
MAENPYVICKSELLVGELKGLRSARITKSFRAIFSVCEECRAKRFRKLVGCSPSLCVGKTRGWENEGHFPYFPSKVFDFKFSVKFPIIPSGLKRQFSVF